MTIDVLYNFWSYVGLTDATAIQLMSAITLTAICCLTVGFATYVLRRLL